MVVVDEQDNRKELRYAGFWRRFRAFNIDIIIIYIFALIIEKIFYFFQKPIDMTYESAKIYFFYIWTIGTLLYFIIMESSSKQGTIGKIFLRIKVTDINGKRISFLRATGRTFTKILSAVIFYIGFFMAGFTKKKQALHDILAGCLVVRIRKQ